MELLNSIKIYPSVHDGIENSTRVCYYLEALSLFLKYLMAQQNTTKSKIVNSFVQIMGNVQFSSVTYAVLEH